MTNDLISDMLTRIRNASLARHSFTYVEYCEINLSILRVLYREGYIKGYRVDQNRASQRLVKTFLKYKGWWIKKPLFSIIRRISTPGQRIFAGYNEFDKKLDCLQYNQGVAIISTSSGIMSHTKAIKLKKGGEILCYVE